MSTTRRMSTDLTAHAVETLEPMTFKRTGGNIWTLLVGQRDAHGYYTFAIGPWGANCEAIDGSVWVGHDGQSDEVECFTLEDVKEALERFREFDAEAAMLSAQVRG